MGIKHEIRTKDGSTRKLTLTPIKAIRYNCLECIGWVPSDVRIAGGSIVPYTLIASGLTRNGRG